MENKKTPKLQFDYDESSDVMTIEGIKYSGELFRQWGSFNGIPSGTKFQIIRDADTCFSLILLQNLGDTIKIPIENNQIAQALPK